MAIKNVSNSLHTETLNIRYMKYDQIFASRWKKGNIFIHVYEYAKLKKGKENEAGVKIVPGSICRGAHEPGFIAALSWQQQAVFVIKMKPLANAKGNSQR